jgi:copper chaperone
MISFQVNDMTCGHCVSSINKAVRMVDIGAKVEIDLATHHVEIESAKASADELREAIQAAGFTPVAIETAARQSSTAVATARKGCCCG